jgi:uncharacterized membrane protein
VFSEIIVLIMAEKEDLDKVWRTFQRNHGGQLFSLVDIVLIQRDGRGKAAFQMLWRDSEYLTYEGQRLAGPLAESIFGASKAEGHRNLTEAGLDPLFMETVDETLTADRSAYLIYVPRESQIDTRRYLEPLESIPGELHHTTFRPQVEEALLKHNG